MTNIILPALTVNDRDAAASIRTEVFEQEMGISIPSLLSATSSRRFDVIAWSEAGEPAGTLSVVETTGEEAPHRLYGLTFPSRATAARYAQLAVRKKFRGAHIPALLILKAQECFVQPEGFDFSWLLFPAARTATSLLCRRLGFRPELPVVTTEYGRCRALVRNEHLAASHRAMVESKRYLEGMRETPFRFAPQSMPGELRV